LTILPVGAADGSLPKTISLVRDEVNLEDQQAKARILDLPTGQGTTVRLGVIDLPSFYADLGGPGERRSATADVARLLKKLKAEHVSGVVLDLRRNGGGSLDEAVSLTGLFIREGPVVQTRGPRGDIDVDADTDPSVLYDGPLVLLISRFSASASEILVGALQDYGRGVVVGDSSTFGKGTVQNILPLAFVMDKMGLEHAYDPGALKVTIRKFYRPNGASTQLRGVASDIVLPSPSDFSEVSESTLKDPLPWDTVTPAPHVRLNRIQPYLSALREKSIQRVKTEKDFALLADDLAQVRKSLATKSVSLNEAERRQELAQSKARQDERVRESRIRFPSRPATYEITLKNVSSPGLPPPLAATKSVGAAHGANSSSAPNALAPDAASRSLDDDIVLNETVKILADYVDLLNGQANPAGPGNSVSAL
jgi:carboxyl-terminal processing protease